MTKLQKTEHLNIGFIGGGNMATAIIGGLIKNGHASNKIFICDPSDDCRQNLSTTYNVKCFDQSEEVIQFSDILVLAVKPQIMPLLSEDLSTSLKDKKTLMISIAAGTRLENIKKWFGSHLPCIRVMPNTPALFGAGISGLFAHADCTESHKIIAEEVMRATGSCVWVNKEEDIDIVTAISGSGPAYFFKMVESLAQAGMDQGLDEETALELAKHTAYGAGLMLLKSENSPTVLREQVTSPGGTTAAALKDLYHNNFEQTMTSAVNAAVERGRELGKNQ